jgi:hypothetical protein
LIENILRRVGPMNFRYDLPAAALIEALFTTDKAACEKYGISTRTLTNYRRRQAKDPHLADLFHTKKADLDARWADVLPRAMREAAQAIAEISSAIRSDAVMRKNPLSLEKLAGALKLCAEVYYTGKVIDARLAGYKSSNEELYGRDAKRDGAYLN